MELKITQTNSRVAVTVIHVSGAVDSNTHEAFEEQANKLIEQGAGYLLVDLTACTFMSSAGLRALHIIFNKLRALHKDANDEQLRKGISAGVYKSPYLKAANLPVQIRSAFEVSGFETYIETFDDLEQAVRSF